ncbi:related to isoamyl alcohol oxidase [Cephalotrichum gorgonifer]|uniref:Related to isoamyl alcohol oxidase n=1 Tax=Cephalotrichum gorgonifer TaxID=2041049 RepID=A0AAE8N5P2_9PEZI|nr:related to isoamyl alcohol oxidase [Cephalotrichum gorgonifer]
MLGQVLALAALLPLALAAKPPPRTWDGVKWDCKCYHGDACWPKPAQWEKLKASVGGNLVVHVPPESACHNTFDGPLGTVETYDAARCAEVNATYTDEQWSTDQDALSLWRYGTNATCNITPNPEEPCTLGYMGPYVILAKEHAHIKAGVDFARKHNLRLIIRNTGHDFLGRSTGWGALIINTHSFKDIDIIDAFDGPGGYDGPAVKIGAGVQGAELLEAVSQRGLAVVTGECPTVGISGGLIQGGGHGPLTTLYGMAADNVLEFDVLTAAGEYLTVNAENEPSLFWALKGGGPSTYAVVLSATLRAYPDLPSAAAELFINFTHTVDPDVYWNGIRLFHKHSNHFVDNGLYVYFELGLLLFRVKPFVAINQTVEALRSILAPMEADLDAAGVPYGLSYKEHASFHDLYVDHFEPEPAGGYSLTGGWLFTRTDVEENNDGIIEAFKTVVSPREDLAGQGFMIGHLWNAGYGRPESNSATNPKFREASDFIISTLPVPLGASIAEKADLQNILTNVQDEALRQAGPNGCAYVNEADPLQENWQGHFWGDLYPDLKALKKKWDPEGLLYAVSTPGTEEWEVIEYGTRLCKRHAKGPKQCEKGKGGKKCKK